MSVLLVNMVYFNEVIYGQDRNIIIEYQPKLTKKEKISFYDNAYDDVIFWFEEPPYYRDRLDYIKLDDSEYGSYISMCGGGFSCKARELTPDLYEVQIEDVRISQEKYERLLERGQDRKFALNATEPEYSLYFRFDGEYLYIYLEDEKTLYATYCAYDGLEEDALYEAIRTNEFDMTKFTFPRHADGTCDYERGGGVPGKKIVDGLYRAQDNLRLRETGSTSGEIITTMKADTYVIILSLGKEETIDGITDNWVEVETLIGSKNLEGDLIPGEVGWCFGGYLK